MTKDDNESPRVVTDSLGKVVQRRDYLPFGEELLAGHGNRTEDLGYSVSYFRHGFAAQQLDPETGYLHYGERYYSPATGRFTSPDPLMASGGAANPQTWNRYSYVVNNPIAYVDSNGELRRDKNGKIKATPVAFGSVTHPADLTSKSNGYFVEIETDKGRRVRVFQNMSLFKWVKTYYVPGIDSIRGVSHDSRQNFNCHGLTFAQGEYNISNKDVDPIIEDDYRPLRPGERPQVGDVVVYYDHTDPNRSPNGVVHSATVVDTDGTIPGTIVAGLGGIQTESRTTSIVGQWSENYVIFRRRKEQKGEPTPQQRAEIARNARKPVPEPIQIEPTEVTKTITPRPLIPLPNQSR